MFARKWNYTQKQLKSLSVLMANGIHIADHNPAASCSLQLSLPLMKSLMRNSFPFDCHCSCNIKESVSSWKVFINKYILREWEGFIPWIPSATQIYETSYVSFQFVIQHTKAKFHPTSNQKFIAIIVLLIIYYLYTVKYYCSFWTHWWWWWRTVGGRKLTENGLLVRELLSLFFVFIPSF